MKHVQKDTLRSLSVCLAWRDPAWISLLESEGLAWEMIDPANGFSGAPEVLVIPHRTPGTVRNLCCELIRRGAAAVSEAQSLNISDFSERQTLCFPYHSEDFSGLEEDRMPGAVCVPYTRVKESRVYQLPFTLADFWCSGESGRKCLMVNPEEKRVVHERLARIVKKNLRRMILKILRRAFFERQLPLVQKWFWPGHSRSVFCLRGDLDGGPVEHLRGYLNAVRPFSGSVTVFVYTAYYRDNPQILKSLLEAGIEVQSHTHCHFLYPDVRTNERNLKKAEEFLLSLGVNPCGLVAPAYFWRPSLHTLLAQRGYCYASCFGLNHDDLPYYPVIEGQKNPVLEIPFHCLGDLFPKFQIELGGPVVRTFFSALIAKKYAAGEPMHLYGHPDMPGRMGSTPELVRFIYEQAMAHSDVWTGQLRQLATWWDRRARFVFQPFFDFSRRCLVLRFPIESDRTNIPAVSIHMPDGSWRLADFPTSDGELLIDSVKPGTPLRESRPTEAGEIIYSPETVSLRQKLWNRKRDWNRLIRKYREIYRG